MVLNVFIYIILFSARSRSGWLTLPLTSGLRSGWLPSSLPQGLDDCPPPLPQGLDEYHHYLKVWVSSLFTTRSWVIIQSLKKLRGGGSCSHPDLVWWVVPITHCQNKCSPYLRYECPSPLSLKVWIRTPFLYLKVWTSNPPTLRFRWVTPLLKILEE